MPQLGKHQGGGTGDFCSAVEGEMVVFPSLQGGHGSIDDRCGCRRSMAGLVSHRATTTIKVADREGLDPGTYHALILDGLMDQGYVTTELAEDPEVNGWVHDLTDDLMRIADAFPVAAILERRGDSVSLRRPGGVTDAVDRR